MTTPKKPIKAPYRPPHGPPYLCPELGRTCTRKGAYDAYDCPSLVLDQRHTYRSQNRPPSSLS